MIDKVIVIGRDMFNVLEKYDVEHKISYIPHWSSIKPKKPLLFKDSKFINERKLQNKFNSVFWKYGTLARYGYLYKMRCKNHG